MIDLDEQQEDLAALKEHSLDVEGEYWKYELDLEWGFPSD